MINDKISVIIPVYKVENYLRQCLDSIVNQTYKNLEIILIDDGSPDKCPQICDEYAAKDSRFVVIHKENGGVGAARNDGVKAATGEWIAFLDSDDWLDLDFFEKMTFSSSENSDVVFGSGYIVEFPTRTEPRKCFSESNEELKNKGVNFFLSKIMAPQLNMSKGALAASAATVWNKLFRLSFIRKIDLKFKYPLGDDVPFAFESVLNAENISVCDCDGYHYRVFLSASCLTRFEARWPEITLSILDGFHKALSLYPDDEMLEHAFEIRTLFYIWLVGKSYLFHPNCNLSNREIKKQLEAYKKNEYVSKAIYSDNNEYCMKRYILLKHLLRLPFVFPVRILHSYIRKKDAAKA